MCDKLTKRTEPTQFKKRINAGALPTDDSLELFAERKEKKVFFMQNGVTLEFKMLSDRYKQKLFNRLQEDPVAWNDLKHLPYSKALEKYAYCVYGSLDHIPDINISGFLGRWDSFDCGDPTCNCKNWISKRVIINGHHLQGRPLEVLLAFRRGRDDKNVSADLNMAMSTLNAHKKKLFEIFQVYNKTELVLAAINARIIQ